MPLREFGMQPPYGRGGAGNFDIVSQENARAAADLEANQSAADSFSQTSSPTDLVRQEPSYVGRGGSGNYGSSEDPSNWDSLNRTTTGPLTKARRDSQAQSPTYGRGGAGNYAAGTSANQRNLYRKITEDEQKREQLKADIESGVDEQLAMPQKAKLPRENSY